MMPTKGCILNEMQSRKTPLRRGSVVSGDVENLSPKYHNTHIRYSDPPPRRELIINFRDV